MSTKRIEAVKQIEPTREPKMVKVYDLDKAIKEASEGKRGAFNFSQVVVLEGPNGIIITDNDAVHRVLKTKSDQFHYGYVDINPNIIALFPDGELAPKVENILELPFEEMEMGQFIRRFGGRIESNYRVLLKSIKEIGLDPDDYPRGDVEQTPMGERRVQKVVAI